MLNDGADVATGIRPATAVRLATAVVAALMAYLFPHAPDSMRVDPLPSVQGKAAKPQPTQDAAISVRPASRA
jgi:hypothetical protein